MANSLPSLSSLDLPQGMEITGEIKPGYEAILTREALELVAALHRTFEPRRQQLLQARAERTKRLDAVFLVNVLDAGLLDGVLYVVVDYLEATDLDYFVREMGALPVPLACEYARQAALALQAARSDDPVTAIVEAGRGRYYYQLPGGAVALGAPAEIPTAFQLVGRLEDTRPLAAAGHTFREDDRLRPFVEAAEKLLETAREVAYGSLEIEYMQSFSAKR